LRKDFLKRLYLLITVEIYYVVHIVHELNLKLCPQKGVEMKKIYSASMTPLTEEGAIDVKSLERMLERNIRHGIDGFFFLGTMGEWTQFDDAQKDTLISAGCKIIGKRAEILAGISATSLNGAKANMDKLSKYDVSAFVITLPPPAYSSVNHLEFIKTLADRSDRPVYFYYLPGLAGRNFSYDEFKEILSHPKIKGIKNSSGSMNTRKELIMLKQEADFTLFEGHEWAVEEALMTGCDGALVGMAPLGSNIFKFISRAVDKGDFEKAIKLQHDLVKIFWGVYGKDLSTVWIGQKYALKKLGIFSTHKTFIQSESALTPQRIKEIDKCLEEYKSIID
jgi:4-hydroxy-tetrahydrodipicolinate synthase